MMSNSKIMYKDGLVIIMYLESPFSDIGYYFISTNKDIYSSDKYCSSLYCDLYEANPSDNGDISCLSSSRFRLENNVSCLEITGTRVWKRIGRSSLFLDNYMSNYRFKKLETLKCVLVIGERC